MTCFGPLPNSHFLDLTAAASVSGGETNQSTAEVQIWGTKGSKKTPAVPQEDDSLVKKIKDAEMLRDLYLRTCCETLRVLFGSILPEIWICC